MKHVSSLVAVSIPENEVATSNQSAQELERYCAEGAQLPLHSHNHRQKDDHGRGDDTGALRESDRDGYAPVVCVAFYVGEVADMCGGGYDRE